MISLKIYLVLELYFDLSILSIENDFTSKIGINEVSSVFASQCDRIILLC